MTAVKGEVIEMGKTGGAVWGVGEHQKLRFGHVRLRCLFEIPVEMFNWLPYLTLSTVLSYHSHLTKSHHLLALCSVWLY